MKSARFPRHLAHGASLALLLGVSAQADFFYLSNHTTHTIYKVTSGGTISVFADSGLSGPMGLAVDLVGNLYVANQLSHTIIKYDSNGTPTTFASDGLNQPVGVAFDSVGNLFVASAANDLILKYDSSGNASVFAFTGLDNPVGLAIDGSDNVYVANYDSDNIRKFTPAGSGSVFASGIPEPFGLAFRDGHLYVGSASQNTIQMFDASGTPSFFAKTGIANPMDLEFDAAGNLFVPNYYSQTITKFDPSANASTFVNDGSLSAPAFLAFVPEPKTELALATTLGLALLLHRWARTGRPASSRIP